MKEEEKKKHEYTVRIPVTANGWDAEVEVKIKAAHQWEACELLGKALSELVAASRHK